MREWIRRKTSRHLMYSWLAWWAVLGTTTLARPLWLIWQISQPDAKGSVAASFGNGAVTLNIVQRQGTVWSGSVDVTTLFLWLCLPPLLLWLVWVAMRPRRVGDAAVVMGATTPQLGAAPPIEQSAATRERSAVPITPLP